MSMISSQTHLATPDDFSDNCGFGLIAHIKGEASHNLVKTAIHSLSCMTHRGGVAADGRTGDGCGLLLATPTDFFKQIADEQQFAITDNFAVGMVFVNLDDGKAKHSQQVLSDEITAQGLEVAGWRDVPLDLSIVGEIGRETLPDFKQVFVNAPDDLAAEDFNRKLFVARKKAEQRLTDDELFYVCS